jgi:hypothetical protein
MDAFLYASAKIIVFNKRQQQIQKFTTDIFGFQQIMKMKARLKSLDL